jgi:hypothetical protein
MYRLFAVVTEHDVFPELSFPPTNEEQVNGDRKKKTSTVRLLERTGMDAEISDIWNFRRRAKIKLNTHNYAVRCFVVYVSATRLKALTTNSRTNTSSVNSTPLLFGNL